MYLQVRSIVQTLVASHKSGCVNLCEGTYYWCVCECVFMCVGVNHGFVPTVDYKQQEL